MPNHLESLDERKARHDARIFLCKQKRTNTPPQKSSLLVLVAMASYGQVDATSAAVSLGLCIPITIASTIAILIIGYRSAPDDSRSSINTDAASQIYRLWRRIRGRGGLPAEILRD
jgi:hypothetical protein